MNCDQTSEYLPWLLNGTLGAGERRAAEEHLRSCAACRQALADTRFAWEVFDQHLPSEQLVAYAWGDPGVDREEVEHHLGSCPRCAAELELVGISRRLQGANDEDDEDDEKVPLLVPAARRRPAPARIWRSSAIAASLVGLIAATGWMESSRRLHSLEGTASQTRPPASSPRLRGGQAASQAASAEELRRSQARMADLTRRNEQLSGEVAAQREIQKRNEEQLGRLEQIAAAASPAGQQPDIMANGATASPPSLGSVQRGATLGEVAARVPVSAPYAVVTFVPTSSTESYDRYELAILDAAGRERRRLRDVHPESGGQFVLWLRKGALAPGSYTLQLYGVRAGERVPLDRYAIQVD
jgi:anti-sigma factor RsiW